MATTRSDTEILDDILAQFPTDDIINALELRARTAYYGDHDVLEQVEAMTRNLRAELRSE